MRALILLALCTVALGSAPTPLRGTGSYDHWQQYKQRYHLNYDAKEDGRRRSIFESNLALSEELHGTHGCDLGETPFSHMTNDEFKRHLKADRVRTMKTVRSSDKTTLAPSATVGVNAIPIPAAVDWRNKPGIVSAIQDQGNCGSCWAFAAAETVRSCNALKSAAGAKLGQLAVQQLVDCSRGYGNYGCDGGMPSWAYMYAKAAGLTTASSYPYIARNGRCRSVSKAATVTGYVTITPNNAEALKAAVAVAPVAVVLEASSAVFQNYVGGIISRGCGTDWDHAVVLVGYGTDKGIDYWILKNSWGPYWGEGGFFKLRRDNSNNGQGVCGINSLSTRPTC